MAIKNGNNNNNILDGTSATDTLNGLGGNDTLRGKDGNDRLDGGTGNDRMEGGKGNDIYIVDSAADVVVELLNQGTDTILSRIAMSLPAHVERLTLLGTTSFNGTGNALNNLIIGNVGNNVLNAGGGFDTVEGRAGNDTLLGGPSSDKLFGQEGNDRLDGSTGSDTLDGGTGADSMLGGTGTDSYVIDNAGDRCVDPDADSIVTFVSTPGVDEGLTVGGDRIDLLVGINVLQGDNEDNCLSVNGRTTRATLIGLGGQDVLQGGDGDDVILGGDGDDNLNANQYTVIAGELILNFEGLVGGLGNDTIDGGNGNDVLDGQAGNDSLIGGAGNDVLDGGNGNDSLLGGDGNDVLNGNNDNDRLEGGAGRDTMTGGFGDDLLVVDSTLDSVIENAGQGTDMVLAWVSFSLFDPDIENLLLANAAGNIHGTGNAVVNTLIGSVGHNILRGLGGNDTLQGRDGNDTLDGGVGSDRMEGGTGNDEFFVDDGADLAIELVGQGTDSVFSTVSFQLSANVENLTFLGTANINGFGNNGTNILRGNPGNNVFLAFDGNDSLFGEEGIDSLFGGTGNDVINGGLGDDLINGGAGIDIMTGGLGSDLFRYDELSDGVIRAVNGALPAGTLLDRVTDFFGSSAGNGSEFFEFASAAFAGGVLGNGPVNDGTSFSIIGSAFNGTNAGVNANHDAGQATFIFSMADRILYYDNNGDAAGYTAIAKLDTGTVSAGDVIINP